MNNTSSVDVIAFVVPENNPSKAKRMHRSEIERWEEIVIRQTIIFFSALTHHRHLRSVLCQLYYPHLLSLLFPRSAKKHIKIQKTHSQKRLSRLIPVYAPLFFFSAWCVNRMHLVAEKSHKAVTTPSFKSHRKNVCLARPSCGSSSSGFGCPFCSGPGCVVLQPPSAVCGVRSLCFPVCW
jgi:hypothetical protein